MQQTRSAHAKGCSCILCSVGAEIGCTSLLDRSLVKSVTEEVIARSYMPDLAVYPVLFEPNQPNFDPLYGESRGTKYGNPVMIKGHYIPAGNTVALTKYGIDDNETAVFFFNIETAVKALGRDPVIGDLILAFDRPNLLHQVHKVEPSGKKMGFYQQFKIDASYYQPSTQDTDLISLLKLAPFLDQAQEEKLDAEADAKCDEGGNGSDDACFTPECPRKDC